MGDHAVGAHHRACGVQVVGDVEQAGQEGLVGAHALGPHGVRRAAAGQLLGIEAALGAHGHDHRVLHLLRLHQAQHFGAEVVAPVRPAQAAPRHGAEAQVDALHVRRPDEDLAVRLGGGQVVQLAAGDLEADIGLGPAVLLDLVEVGALHGQHQPGQAAQHPVLVQAIHRLQRLGDAGEHRLRLAGAVLQRGAHGGVELDLEHVQDQAHDLGIGDERRLLHGLAGIEPALLAIAGEGSHQRHLAPAIAQLQHQAVEAVVLGRPAPDRQEGLLEGDLHVGEQQVLAALVFQHELMHPGDHPAAVVQGLGDGEAFLGERLQAHVLQHGQNLGQRHGVARAVELEAEAGLGVVGVAEGADAKIVRLAHALDDRQVGQGLGGVVLVAITGREAAGVAGEQLAHQARRHAAAPRRRLETVRPGAHRLGDLRLQRALVRLGPGARRDGDDVADSRQRRVRQGRRRRPDVAAPGPGHDLARPILHIGAVAVAGDEQQGRDVALQAVGAGEQAHPRPVVEVQHA